MRFCVSKRPTRHVSISILKLASSSSALLKIFRMKKKENKRKKENKIQTKGEGESLTRINR